MSTPAPSLLSSSRKKTYRGGKDTERVWEGGRSGRKNAEAQAETTQTFDLSLSSPTPTPSGAGASPREARQQGPSSNGEAWASAATQRLNGVVQAGERIS